MGQLIISVSGLRGIVGQSLTPVVAANYVAAFAAGLPKGETIILTHDGRTSGPMFARAVGAALQGSGLSVLNAEIAATPTTGVLVRTHRAIGGIQISASHNPIEYNGLKLFGSDGRVISAKAGQEVVSRFRNESARWVSAGECGSYCVLADSCSVHLQSILKTVNVDKIRNRRFKVVLDSNHGAGSVLGVRLLKELNCEVTLVGGQPDGHFEHPPEPTAENLGGTAEHATRFGANVVFCQDPDADRLAIIDERGNYIGEEFTLALVVDHVLSQSSPPGTIVTNCSTSRMSADVAAKYGFELRLSSVGEANVADAIIESNAIFGGEGNGGPIDPRVGYVRDSFVGMAQVLDLMAARELAVSQLVSQLPQYAIRKTTINVAAGQFPKLIASLKRAFVDATSNEMDGLRLDWPNKWLLIRPSNTEPIVRAVAEARTAAEANQLCDVTAKICQEL